MDCQEFSETLEILACDGPDFELTPDLASHQAQCEQCRNLVTAWQDSWNTLATALEQPSFSSEFESSVMERIQAAPQAKQEEFDRASLASYALAATVLVALIGATAFVRPWSGKRETASETRQDVEQIAAQMGKLEELEKTYAHSAVQYVSLTSTADKPQVRGYFVCDQQTNEAHFFAYGLIGQNDDRFRLWLLGANKSILASTPIDTDSQHLGAAKIAMPKDLDVLQEILVSRESDENPDSPSDDVRLVAPIKL